MHGISVFDQALNAWLIGQILDFVDNFPFDANRMFTRFKIKNYKSILEHTMELGRLNILIGENGSGKSNILEAVAMAGAAYNNRFEDEELYNRGIRIAKPSITFSSFRKIPQSTNIRLELDHEIRGSDERKTIVLNINKRNEDDNKAAWVCDNALGSIAEQTILISQETEKVERQLAELVNQFLDKGEQFQQFDKQIRPKLSRLKDYLDKKSKADEVLVKQISALESLEDFVIYNANHLALRGLEAISRKTPVGINGENLDVFLANMDNDEWEQLKELTSFVPWFKAFIIDKIDALKFGGYKLGRSTSKLYFKDRYMRNNGNIFSAENANEGILHILFYASIFGSSKTPKFFGIDNIETALNPQMCRELIKRIVSLSKKHDKQAIITTHNPAVLDGLNLHDEEQRLFVVYRNDEGHTLTNRIKLKPDLGEGRFKLSELWMRGHLGGIPKSF